ELPTMPVISERSNIIVMADEAHRSHYAAFARNLIRALPRAVRIAFTGTPIEAEERSTSLTFGDYISEYSIGRAVDDGATVPIYYESRAIPLAIADPGALRKVDEVLEQDEVTAPDP